MTPQSHPFWLKWSFVQLSLDIFTRNVLPAGPSRKDPGKAGHGKVLVAVRRVMRRASGFFKRLFFYFRSPGNQLPQLGGLLGEGNHQLRILALRIKNLFEERIFRGHFIEHLL